MKSINILGSTGSIGTQALDIVKANPDKFNIKALSANSNIELLKKQIDEFNPEIVAVMDKEKADELKRKVEIPVYGGIEGFNKIATMQDYDILLTSVVGSIGLVPTIKAIENKKTIALANKETLVTAGKLVMEKAMINDVKILPVDSEHSAIFQCIGCCRKDEIKRLILTCSGGPFKDMKDLSNVTLKDALAHPTWNMGSKITVDSATLMNKGFEVIEAHHLYDINFDKIDVIVHPQSIIHSLVEFIDHSTLAQLSFPDMKIPIQYAFSYPERIKNSLRKLDLAAIGKMDFSEPNMRLFPCLDYAYEAGKIRGTMPAVLNAANEAAVSLFLNEKIKFVDIPRLIKKEMDEHKVIKNPELDEILDIDRKIKERLLKWKD